MLEKEGASMTFKGRGIALVLSVTLMSAWHMYNYIRQPTEYYYAFVRGSIVFEIFYTFTVLFMSYLLGRQFDRTEYYHRRNVSYARYIEEMNQIEKELRASEERYRHLVERSPEPIALYSDNRIVYINPSGAKMLGANSPEDIVGLHGVEIVHPEDYIRMTDLSKRVLQGLLEADLNENRFYKVDGSIIDVEVKAINATYGGNPAIQLLCRDITERKRTELELQRAKQELHEAMRHQQGMMFKFKKENGRFVYTMCDGELVYQFGVTPEDIVGKSIEAIAGADSEAFIERYERAWSGSESETYELSISEKTCLIMLRPIKHGGIVTEVVGSCTDITLRKQTEEELRQTTELLESFFANTSDAIDVLDLQDNPMQVNRAFEKMFGWSQAEVMERGVEIIVPFHLLEERRKLHENILNGGYVNGYETQRLRKNGDIIDISVTISPLRDNKRSIIGIAAITRDISERKEVEAALRESEAKYRLIAENMTDMIALLNPEGRAEYVSPSSAAILGAAPEMFVGDSLIRFVHPDDRDKFKQGLTAMTEQKPGILEFRILHQDGRWAELEATGRVVPGDGEDRDKVVVVVRDITERKKTEELLRRSEKLTIVGQLAAGVAHEIRNPLTSLKGFLQLMNKKIEGQDYIFNLMLSELERINEIVSEFLVIAKPQIARFQRHNLTQIVRNVVSLLETQAIMSNVMIELTYQEDEGIIVDCDENQLKQVFINILKNAVEAMTDGGTVRVEIEAHRDGYVCVRFTDEGPGIPEEQIPRLGEPFYTTKEKGTGLGLMVSFKIIEDHKGRIEINSSLGSGTVFDVLLPADFNMPVKQLETC